jgi:hypothetical protein
MKGSEYNRVLVMDRCSGEGKKVRFEGVITLVFVALNSNI